MFRTIALTLVLLLPVVARADMALFPQRDGLPVEVTLTIEHDYPEYEFFLVDRDTVQRVSLTTAVPLILKSEDRGGRIFGVALYGVPKVDLVDYDQSTPPLSWFDQKKYEKYHPWTFHERNRVDFYDNRNLIEKTYEVRRLQGSWHLELLVANEGNRWVKRAWGGICCVLPPAAIVLSVIWLLRRLYRNWKGP